MTERTGLGPVEVALLEAIGPRRTRVRCSTLLAQVEASTGIAPAYSYPVLVDLQAPWKRHVLLVDGNGNFGSPGDDLPADPTYTEVRLSPVGLLALRAERGEIGPLPLDLVDGSLYAGGAVPPFDPPAVVTALLEGAADCGPPVLPSGGEVDGDVAALLRGRWATLQLGSRIVREPGRLVLTGIPLGVSRDAVPRSLHQRALLSTRGRRHYTSAPWPPTSPHLLQHVVDESDMRVGTRIVVELVEGANPLEAESFVRGFWPVTVDVLCRLPAPQRRRLREWDRGDGSGLAALAGLLGVPLSG